jgi:hypothetical protein
MGRWRDLGTKACRFGVVAAARSLEHAGDHGAIARIVVNSRASRARN